MPRYIILGAGAVGGALGGRLRLAGCSVVLVARGEHLAALRERGLRLRTPDEDVTQSVPAIAGPQEIELDVDDVLILTTKTQQANDAIVSGPTPRCTRTLGRLAAAGERLPIFIALNGVAAETMAIGTFDGSTGSASGCRPCIWSLGK